MGGRSSRRCRGGRGTSITGMVDVAATRRAVADPLRVDLVWFAEDISQVSAVEVNGKDADDGLQWRMLLKQLFFWLGRQSLIR